MRTLISLVTMTSMLFLAFGVRAQDADLFDEIMRAYAAINIAFEQQDTAAITAMTAADHVAITPEYGGALGLADQLGTVPDLDFTQTPVGEIAVASLSQDVALMTFTADMTGTYRGEPIARRSVITIIWLRQDGTWRERLYQETPVGD